MRGHDIDLRGLRATGLAAFAGARTELWLVGLRGGDAGDGDERETEEGEQAAQLRFDSHGVGTLLVLDSAGHTAALRLRQPRFPRIYKG